MKIPLHGYQANNMCAVVDDTEDNLNLLNYRWYYYTQPKKKRGYVRRSTLVNEGRPRRVVWLHKEILKPLEGYYIDHINRDTLDNRRNNLRHVTSKESAANRDARIKLKSDPDLLRRRGLVS